MRGKEHRKPLVGEGIDRVERLGGGGGAEGGGPGAPGGRRARGGGGGGARTAWAGRLLRPPRAAPRSSAGAAPRPRGAHARRPSRGRSGPRTSTPRPRP